MKKLLSAFVLIALFSGTRVMAQQDAIITQYMFNGIYYNPAVAGLDGVGKFALLHRTQWIGGGETSPNTQLFSYSMPIAKINSGIGAYILRDQIGPLTNIDAQISYAYHQTVGTGKLSYGARFGLASRSFDVSRLVYKDQGDAYIPTTSSTANAADLSLGVNYKADKYFFGLSVAHLIPSKFDLTSAGKSINPLAMHYYINGGYNFELNQDWTLTPSVLFRSSKVSAWNQTSFDFNVMANYQSRFWLGGSYRDQFGPSLLAGVGLLKDNALRINFAFDLSVPSNEIKKPASAEIMASYILPIGMRPAKPIIRTPRYRK
jgi:type IX secretion system PorP/SprF family membrane protein